MKKSGAVFALILAAVVLAFVIAEEALRIAGISYPNFSSFWTRDPYCGVVLLPGASGWWTKEGRAFVVINSDGMRDREHTIAKPPNTFRIAVLGDSYAEALQVSVQEAFWAVMQRELAACPFLAGR